MECIEATTNNWDIRPSVTVKVSLYNISWIAGWIHIIKLALESAHQMVSNDISYIIWRSVFIEIQAYQYSDIISYLLKLAWHLLWQMTAPIRCKFDYVMETACTQTITLLCIYLYVWGLNFRLNNINYSCWYYSSPIIIIFLY